jgi:diguanylate cyclase (GGDEF)-like protein
MFTLARNNKRYLALILGLIILLSSLIFSYNNIQRNNRLLKELDRVQIKLNYYTSQLNHDTKNAQVTLLQDILLKHPLNNEKKIFHKIAIDIKKLEKYAVDKQYLAILHTVKKRLRAYEFVGQSLVEAVKSGNKIDIEDAMLGLNSISLKFVEDTQKLTELVNAALYQQLFTIHATNERSATLLLFAFTLATILLLGAFYQFHLLQQNLQTQLQRAKKAESELKNSQLKLLSYNQDLEREVNEKSNELLQKIYTHPITALANRNRLLEDLIEYNISYMAILNIDKFQSFNDVYGEEIGNEALQFTAAFLKEAIQELPFMLYHIGGDEFTIVSLHDISIDAQKFVFYIEKILTDYSHAEFVHNDIASHFKMSAGITCQKDKKMLAYADMALKEAKQKNIILSIFSEDKNLETYHKEDIACRQSIDYALENGTLLSFFQPIIPIQDHSKATKYESLVRLQDKNGKIIPPFRFLDVAKRHKLYHKITYRVINNTLSTIANYKIPCSFNFSLSDMSHQETMRYLENTLKSFAYPELITIELLETEEFQNYDFVYDFCKKVKAYGVKIALDDFGSGYSNFSHALRLPIDYIKIDASLISPIESDIHSQIMVETIVTLAKKLGVETIAEFVASEVILQKVQELGVDYAQGFHLGKPLRIEEHIKR